MNPGPLAPVLIVVKLFELFERKGSKHKQTEPNF